MALFSRTTHEGPVDDVLGARLDDREAVPARSRGIGQALKEARQSFGRDIAQISSALRIRGEYLEAIETGRYEALPGPTYAVGFIRTYSEYLGLDGVEMVRRFKQETEGLDLRRDLSFPMPLTERSIPGGTILLLALILGLCGYGIWYYLSSANRAHTEHVGSVPGTLLPPTEETTAAAPPPATQSGLVPPPTAALAAPPSGVSASPVATSPAPSSLPPPPSLPTAVTAAPTPAAPSPALSSGGVATSLPSATASSPAPRSAAPSQPPATQPTVAQPAQTAALPSVPAVSAPADPSHTFGVTNGPARIVIRATGTAWIQIRDSQENQIFTRVMRVGDVYRVPDKPGLLLRTGNAGGIEVSVDGKTAPSLGTVGVIRHTVVLDPQKLLAGSAVAD
jgi:cytoskeleton protein RodZ